ncbi:MAG: Mur ligase family protein [Actinomycetota bacterium]|nr:Mur ligase family protein [Actinomycetota bacterium]
MRSAVEWVESLTPWPEEFGLRRMRALLDRLGAPQLAYPSIHVVGTNGKTTTVRMTEALLAGEGLAVGAYTSPHVTGWGERIRLGGEEADFERALQRVRPLAEELEATQFEALTAAALAAFAEAEVDAAVVEAGLGGRLDATNVLRSPVQVLTNVALEHTEHLGETREAIAREKLAVVQAGATVVLAEPEWEALARANGAGRVVLVSRSNLALAAAAAEAFLGRPVATRPAEELQVPGRLERVGERPLEIWDGAHTLDAVGYVLARLPRRRWTLVLSILADKDVDRLLAAFSALGDHVVATQSANSRALPAPELARRAERFFPRVEAVDDPVHALFRAREAAGEEGAVLVSGSLYLLASLAAVRTASVPWESSESD